MTNKIFLFPLTLAVIFFASMIIIFSPVGKKNIIEITSTSLPISWQTYTNNQYGFEFQYPNNWDLIIFPEAAKNENGDILTLQSPETKSNFEQKKLFVGSPDNFMVSHYSNVNNEYLLGGSWTGQREYKNLLDFLNDPTVPFVQKVGLIMIGDKQAYKVSIGGHYVVYGIMIETTSGIFEISFPTAFEESDLTDNQNQILSTFKFTQ